MHGQGAINNARTENSDKKEPPKNDCSISPSPSSLPRICMPMSRVLTNGSNRAGVGVSRPSLSLYINTLPRQRRRGPIEPATASLPAPVQSGLLCACVVDVQEIKPLEFWRSLPLGWPVWLSVHHSPHARPPVVGLGGSSRRRRVAIEVVDRGRTEPNHPRNHISVMRVPVIVRKAKNKKAEMKKERLSHAGGGGGGAGGCLRSPARPCDFLRFPAIARCVSMN